MSRVIGAGDLIVATGLLAGRDRSRWMSARALLNAVLALSYAGVLRAGAPRPGRAVGWLGLMVALTAFDYALSRRLR